ncbi:MAG: nucleoside monophosphate kinase [Chitinispirillaceae bacterium]|nr:nucleoside monophosphate kinase [Chitinispirillaceae bacterium]
MAAYTGTTILLLGPTGSGKTPLGDALAAAGCNGRKTAHFDFGAQLRTAVEQPQRYPLLTPANITLLERKLCENALLEDSDFYIAERILGSFITTGNLGESDYLLLNGLPRHTGQAEALEPLLSVTLVIHLECTPEVVLDRIRSNAGGDRTLRNDDSTGEVERKLDTFRQRTLPLLEYYTKRNVPVRHITVETGMSIREMMMQTGLF